MTFNSVNIFGKRYMWFPEWFALGLVEACYPGSRVSIEAVGQTPITYLPKDRGLIEKALVDDIFVQCPFVFDDNRAAVFIQPQLVNAATVCFSG